MGAGPGSIRAGAVCRVRSEPDKHAGTSAADARTDNVKEVLHGVEIGDPYRWLEDQNAPETRAWIDAQNTYMQSLLSKLPGRKELKQKLTALLKIESIDTPAERNGRYFFTKRLASQDQAVLYLRKGLEGKDEVLIDPNPMSPDHTISVSGRSLSRDGTLLVYAVRQGGEDEIVPHLFDVDARKNLPDRLPKARYWEISLLPDKSGIYYTRMTPEGPRVYFHKVGMDAVRDIEIFGKGYGPEKIIRSRVSDDGRYLLIHVRHGSAADRTEVYVKDVSRGGPVTSVVNDIPARFLASVAGDRVFLHTNWKAPKGRVLAVDLKDPAREHWREIIPEGEAVIEEVTLAGGKVGVQLTQNASSRLRLYEPDGKLVREIALPAIGTASSLRGRWSSNEAFYTFDSFYIPDTIYRYDVATGAQQIWAQLQVPIEADKYEIKQIWYASKDGTKVPMFLAHAKGIKLDATNPTILTGYGGFTLSQTPTYTARAAACSRAAACTRWPICGAGASSAKSGTAPACWATSRMSSTTLSLRRNGSSKTNTPARRASRSTASAMVACWLARR